MAYDPLTDFLALTRQTPGGARLERMPGLDYVVAALARMGFCEIWANPTAAPTTNLANTVWLKTSATDWAAEGSVFLYNSVTGDFEPATPELWQAFLTPSTDGSYKFQSVVLGAGVINTDTTLLAVIRDNPGITTLTLPAIGATRTTPLQIVDWSSSVAAHQLLINAAGGETVMQSASFSLFSTAVQLSGVTLQPSPELAGWVIAP